MKNGNNEGGTTSRLARRQFLAGVGAGTVASLAGCAGVTNQSFEATSVGLSSSASERLQLAESDTDTLTVERSAADGNVSVSVTSHTAVYSRASAIGGR